MPDEIEYLMMPDGTAEIRIRRNIERKEDDGGFYEYDEVYIREPLTREYAIANKDTIWKRETCITQRYELEDAIVELAEIIGGAQW